MQYLFQKIFPLLALNSNTIGGNYVWPDKQASTYPVSDLFSNNFQNDGNIVV